MFWLPSDSPSKDSKHANVTIRMDASNILRTKCVIVGNSTVGKTALVQSFISEGRNFPKNYNMTFGVDLNVKSIAIPDTSDSVEMFIYDSSGRDLYIDCLPKYWHEPSLFMAVYDVTSKSSLEAVHNWVELVRNCIPAKSAAHGILFGNKTDLTERRTVSPKAGAAAAEKLNLLYFEGSAKENEGIEEPFFYLAHEWHKQHNEQQISSTLIT